MQRAWWPPRFSKPLKGCCGPWLVQFLPSPPHPPESLVNTGNPDKQRGMDSDLSHKSVTQNHSEQVKNTIRRNGTYHYRRRIPSDLVKAAAFGYKKNGKTPQDTINCSLRTKDPQVARRRMAIEDTKAEEEFEALRQEMMRSENEEFLRRRNPPENNRRKFSSLSAPERRDFIFCLFIELERKRRPINGVDQGDRQETIEGLGEDLAALEGNNPVLMPINWDERLKTYLNEKGFDIDDSESAEFTEMRDMLQRAHVENTWRSFKTVEGHPHKENDPLFKGLSSVSSLPSNPLSRSKSVGDLCSSYLEVSKARLTSGTIYKHELLCKLMRESFGKNTPLSNITVEKAKGFVSFLAKVPVNASKYYPSLSLKKASAKESKKDNPRFLAPKTQRDMFDGIKAMFNHAHELEWIESNPLGKKVLSNMLPKVNSTSPPPPTPDDLNALFSSEKYLCERGKDNRGDARFWVPLLCLFHGFRANEVCQLLVSDIQGTKDIPFIHLREKDDDGNIVKHLKTTASQRRVPIHNEVVKMGFFDFVLEQQASGEPLLFPMLNKNKRDSKAGGVSSWFARIKKSLFADIPSIRGAKGLHSLRHAFVRACRDAEVEQPLRWALGGWSSGGKNSEADYGDGYSMTTLKAAIDKVQYPNVDLSNLYPPKS